MTSKIIPGEGGDQTCAEKVRALSALIAGYNVVQTNKIIPLSDENGAFLSKDTFLFTRCSLVNTKSEKHLCIFSIAGANAPAVKKLGKQRGIWSDAFRSTQTQ